MAKNKNLGIFIILGIILIGLFLYYNPKLFENIQTTISPPLTFAGFIFGISTSEDKPSSFNNGKINVEGEYLILKITSPTPLGDNIATSGAVRIKAITEIKDIDEILILADAEINAQSSFGAGSGATLSIGIEGLEGGQISSGFSLGVGTNEQGLKSEYFEPKVFIFKNNFDGTWSTLKSFGVGDVFIKEQTKQIIGTPYLFLQVGSSVTDSRFANGNIFGRIYNIIPKESGFAVCKADEYWQDLNQNGRATSDECFNLTSIVLRNEEALKESFDEKIARIIEEQEAKNKGLTEEIERLKKLLKDDSQERINELEEELAITNQLLERLKVRDEELLDAIQKDEKIKIINNTIVIEKTVFVETLAEQVTQKEIPTFVLIIGGIVGLFILLRLFKVLLF